MALKTNAKSWTIKEQIIEDSASGLTFQFETLPCGEFRLRIYGDSLPCGNRELMFDVAGDEAGAGTTTSVLCRPAWMERVGD